MARVTTPLLCLNASGKFANTFVASTWKGLKVMRQYVTPANPRTVAQLAQRETMTIAVNAWRNFFTDLNERRAWNLTASVSGKAQSGFNAFMSGAQQRLQVDPSASFADSESAQPGGGQSWEFRDLDTGILGTETGLFEVWLGTTATNLLLFESLPLVAGELNTTSLGSAGEIVFVKARKDGVDRSGIAKKTLQP